MIKLGKVIKRNCYFKSKHIPENVKTYTLHTIYKTLYIYRHNKQSLSKSLKNGLKNIAVRDCSNTMTLKLFLKCTVSHFSEVTQRSGPHEFEESVTHLPLPFLA